MVVQEETRMKQGHYVANLWLKNVKRKITIMEKWKELDNQKEKEPEKIHNVQYKVANATTLGNWDIWKLSV